MCAEIAHADCRHLTASLPDYLLRGVPLDRALECFGSHWANPELNRARDSGFDASAAYAVSRPVLRLDDFISHDWQTGRWPKFICLCAIYNAPAAVVASVLTKLALAVSGAASSLLEVSCGDGHRSSYASLLCGLVFWSCFVFWQSIRGCICRCPTRRVFIDKLCIHQSDDQLKQEGILSIAGFVQHSDCFVVLWSPHYFSRMWCTFEVAAWLRFKQDPGTSLHFMPVAWGVMVVFVAALGNASILVDDMFCYPQVWTYIVLALLCTLLVCSVGSLAESMLGLPAQLESFSIRSAKSFCCSCDHVHPDTRACVPCDRELVYATLTKWYAENARQCGGTQDFSSAQSTGVLPTTTQGQQPSLETMALDDFDLYVRAWANETLGARREQVIPFRVKYWHSLVMGVGWGWRAADSVGMFLVEKSSWRLRIALWRVIVYLCLYPVNVLVIAFTMAIMLRPGCGERKVAHMLFLVLLSFVVMFAFMSFRLEMLDAVDVGNPGLQVTVSLVLGAMTAWGYGLRGFQPR